MDNLGVFEKIVNGELPEAPITKLLGWNFLEFDDLQQVIKVEMQARPEFINPAGFIHGGMLAAMLDETLSPALAATLGPGEFAPTLEIKVNFISPAKVGRVLGTGRVVSRGRSICSWKGNFRTSRGISSRPLWRLRRSDARVGDTAGTLTRPLFERSGRLVNAVVCKGSKQTLPERPLLAQSGRSLVRRCHLWANLEEPEANSAGLSSRGYRRSHDLLPRGQDRAWSR